MRIRVKTPSRLHLSLIDLEGSLGRVDGGIGLALERPNVILEAEAYDGLKSNDGVAKQFAGKVLGSYDLEGASIQVKERIPEHVGLGGTTQMALAVALAVTRAHDIDADTRELARTVGRGGTSGIGIAAFENGGFILDAGHRASEKKGFSPSRFSRASPPTALLRYEVPRDWKCLCVLPETRGAHGKTEMDIFKRYCPIPKAEVGEVSRIVLMNVLPGVAERDIEEFGSGINRLQKTGFKRVEVSLQGEPVKELLGFLKDNSYGAGMSSFGPLCFGLFDKKGDSKSVGREAKELLAQTGLDSGVFLAGADNKGARIS